ncbi:MAG: VWA domain-containing protein [Ardenticatenia bacterium]|nr:VWA domain-containing protein [Ardenticatenia bacterium]
MRRHERGQSLLIMGVAMAALLALMALVIDAGNGYVQRRIVQNATDAAALAGGVELAMTPKVNGRYAGSPADERRILEAVIRVAQENGIPDTNGNPDDLINDNITVYFVGPGGERLGRPLPQNRGVPPQWEVAGIEVETDKEFGTYFARLVGLDRMTAAASAQGLANPNWCPGSGDNLFPIAISTATFAGDPGGQPVPGQTYRIWEKGRNSSYGNFGWLSWNNDPSNTTLVANLHDLRRSGTWRVGDLVPGATGVQVSRGVRNELDAYIAGRLHNGIEHDPSVVVPVYDYTVGQGNNLRYHIVGFAKFRITDYKFRGRSKWIEGTFERFVASDAEPGGECYLGSTVKLREPKDQTRSIVGTVHINEVFFTPGYSSSVHVPVDVMLVMDISGSMRARWSGGSSKLQSAKDALLRFNSYLQPDKGDRVGLTTYPYITRGRRYRTVCRGYRLRSYYFGQVRSPLTNNVAYVNNIINGLRANGGTPIAHALQQAREQLLNDLRPGAVPVIILASDGIANITIDGKWTGFGGGAGQGQNTPPCNNQAEQQTIDQANLAKEAGIIIFSIAIGDGFNMDVLQATASPDFDLNGNGRIDPNERHFFVARSDADLDAIYEQIGNRVRNIAQEGKIRTQETAGEGAVVRLYNVNTGSVRTTVAGPGGAFAFEDIEPGTYRITAWATRNGLTYDILTDGNGGPPLNPQYVEIQVGQGTGTTDAAVIYLSTDDIVAP